MSFSSDQCGIGLEDIFCAMWYRKISFVLQSGSGKSIAAGVMGYLLPGNHLEQILRGVKSFIGSEINSQHFKGTETWRALLVLLV